MLLITRDRIYNMDNAEMLDVDHSKYGYSLILYMNHNFWRITHGKEAYIMRLKRQIEIAWAHRELEIGRASCRERV